MESEGAGLELVDYIRNELKNETVRIILRTGQPGQAPERRVIVDYDINDYKAKTELTADKLFTTLTAALRSYHQLQRMVETRRGLEIIIDAASTLFDFRSMQRLAEGVLTQIASLLNVECAGILVLREEGDRVESFSVLAGSGCYSKLRRPAGAATLEPNLRELVEEAFDRRVHAFHTERSVLYIGTGSGREVVVLLEAGGSCPRPTGRWSRCSAAGSRPPSTTSSSTSSCSRRMPAWRSGSPSARRELTVANERLAGQSERLRHANRFKSEILGTVAHDLKNPLGVILGRAEMLSELLAAKPLAKDAAAAQIGHIRDSARA